MLIKFSIGSCHILFIHRWSRSGSGFSQNVGSATLIIMKYPVLPLSRHDGPEGLPVRGPHHEEAAPSQAHPALRCLHPGGAHLYHHGAHEIRQPARILARWAVLVVTVSSRSSWNSAANSNTCQVSSVRCYSIVTELMKFGRLLEFTYAFHKLIFCSL